MANSLLILSMALYFITELVTTSPLMDYDKMHPPGDSVNTNKLGPLEGIVHFEIILANEKAKLLSPSLYLNDDEEHLHARFYDTPRTLRNCSSHIDYVIDAARRRIPWALDMIDSTGKPSSGVLQGNDLFVGDFDQCMDVDTELDFEGQYCTTRIWISEILNTTLEPTLQFTLGLCFPSSCEANDLENNINIYFQSRPDISAIAMQTHCQERHLSLTTKAKVIICICSIFVTLLVIGTFYDVVFKRWWLEEKRYQNASHGQNGPSTQGSTTIGSSKVCSEHEPIIDPKMDKPKLYSNNERAGNEKSSSYHEVFDKLLMSFSVYTNTVKLLATHQSRDSIDCIHGMRFISMTWIILLHTYGMSNGGLENVLPFLDKSNSDWTYMAIIKSCDAVDTFFAMSGLLLTFVTLKKLTQEKVTPKFIGIFYLHRYLRLTPTYMLILMTYVPLFKYLSDGPFWPQDGIEIDECEGTWWTNLLYVNNFVKMHKMCMGWTWYLACDMQFYLVSPLIFLPMLFYEWRGLIVSFAFLLGNAICAGVITNEKDLIAVSGGELWRPTEPGSEEFRKYYYFKPYTRIGPFVIGMMTGFLLFKSECKARISKLVVIFGWIAATAIALTVVYGLYDHVRYDDRQSTDVRALYNALHCIAWGISVSWVIFACVNGYGGFVNTLLSWKVFIPLSRLTYCAYLVHPLIVRFFFLSQRKPFFINYLNMTFAFAAVLVLTYAVAYIAYMAYEIPLTGLEKIIRGLGKKK